jgi:adenylate cyclase
VWHGFESLAAPAAIENAALKRIAAPNDVRLACQVRPEADIAITPLVPVTRMYDGLRFDLNEARERPVTALHADLRDSVRLAAGRLPYDTLFIIDRYIQAATAAILANGGHITSVAGDGIMSVFGVDCDEGIAARQALSAAAALWRGIDQVSADLAGDIAAPLKFGIGIHSGLAVIGMLGPPDQQSLQFLGETGNIAARLQGLSKDMNCTLIVSAATAAAAGREEPPWRRAEVGIRGADGAMWVFLIDARDGLDGF